MSVSRRQALCATLVTASLAGFAGSALAQTKTKVAAIYTVPVEQQWVSRIDKALKAAVCLLYTSPSPRDRQKSRMPSSA